MADRFDYFVVFAEMRTGSNFLETNLNAFDGLSCVGEAFNPHFIGYPNKSGLLGLSQADRDADPGKVLAAVRAAPEMTGFRFFHDHDPRVLDPMLDDPRCAKIILTRNPLDSYVSWKIAQATGQWKLTDVKRRKDAKARFEPEEFAAHVADLQAFQVRLLNALQRSGQTAFYVGYDDLGDVEVMNGLAAWLGVDERLESLDQSLKRQNPSPVTSKVSNPEDMAQALADLDAFNLHRTPNFEPRRGPAVPSYVAGHDTPLLYMPVRGGPEAEVTAWLAALDGAEISDLRTKASQKELRKWLRGHPEHRSFTVLRHPVVRAHAVFCSRILPVGEGSFLAIRDTLRRQFKLPIPKGAPDETYTRADHRAAFEGFLSFVKANLAGQTGMRTDAAWASQSQALTGFAEFVLPDVVLREAELSEALPALAARFGKTAPFLTDQPEAGPYRLDEIYDPELEAQVAAIYKRDYLLFGFEAWQSGAE